MCRSGWDSNDADVVCFQVGFSTGAREIPGISRFGSGTGRFWLKDIACIGNERHITNCPNVTFSDQNCIADATVICHG